MQERAERTKTAILEAAEKEFSELGFYGSRVDRISDNSGVNKSLIYKYFGNKSCLYTTVFGIVYDRFTELEKELLAVDNPDWKAKISHFVEMEFDFCHRNRSYVRMIMWENLNKKEAYSGKLNKTKQPILNCLKEIIEQVNTERRTPLTIDEYDLLITMYSCCFFYFSNTSTLSEIVGDDLSSERIIEHRVKVVSDLLIHYLEEKN